MATKDRNSGKVGQGHSVFSGDRHHNHEGFLVAEAEVLVRVEEAGLGDENGLGIKDSGLKEISQARIIFGMSLAREPMNGQL